MANIEAKELNVKQILSGQCQVKAMRITVMYIGLKKSRVLKGRYYLGKMTGSVLLLVPRHPLSMPVFKKTNTSTGEAYLSWELAGEQGQLS